MDKVTSLIDECSHFVRIKDCLCHSLNVLSGYGIYVVEQTCKFSCLVVEEIEASEVEGEVLTVVAVYRKLPPKLFLRGL